MKNFKDFIFNGKKLSGLSTKYCSVSFDSEDEKNLGLSRSMEVGEINRYKIEGNYYGDSWNEGLPIQLNIMKDLCAHHQQKDLEISKSEIRELTRWLTSPHFPKWIEFEYDEDTDINEGKFYKGWFESIETWVIGGKIYGLILTFRCTTPFAYTDEIANTKKVSSFETIMVDNNSDEEESYCYPTIEIKPTDNSDIYICNLSDCNILDHGLLNASEGTYIDALLNVAEEYAKLNGYTLTYTGTGAYNIVTFCNDTGVQFYLTDKYNNTEKKCTAFYSPISHEYRIVDGGFIYMTVKSDLDVYLDSQRLTLHDSLDRMITYDELGITDVDFIYWPRLIHGTNELLVYGDNVEFIIKHRESRKVGE